MLLKASPSSSLSAGESLALAPPCWKLRASPCSFARRAPCCIRAGRAQEVVNNNSLTGVVFMPFQEVQSQLSQVPASCSQSFARQRYSSACESAINEQINVEYNASYVYHTLFAYFDRDNVALPGLAQFFKDNSDEEREHAEKLMKYQNTRGGRVKLQSIVLPSMTEFDNEEKGDALWAMELTLALERLVNEKLLNLHKIASAEGDPQLTDYIEGEFLKPQVEDIKKVSEYVSQLRRVGKGHVAILEIWPITLSTWPNRCRRSFHLLYTRCPIYPSRKSCVCDNVTLAVLSKTRGSGLGALLLELDHRHSKPHPQRTSRLGQNQDAHHLFHQDVI